MLPPNTGKFLEAVRRRITLIRLLESVGISCAVASGLGAVLVCAIGWRGESGAAAAAAMLGLGIFSGLVWGMMRIPTLPVAAAEADRQLGLSELLGTILRCDSTGDSWAQAVAAMAEDRCKNLRPAELIIARLGLRSWGGVGLSAALLMTLALLTARPADLRAESQIPEISSSAIAIADLPIPIVPTQLPPVIPSRPAVPGAADAGFDRPIESQQPADSSSSAPSADNRAEFQAASYSGAGDGLSITPGSHWHLEANSSASSDAPGFGPASAGGQSNSHAATSGHVVGDSTSAGPSVRHAPVWHSAGGAVATGRMPTNGHVPDWAADLVQDYFQRD